MHTLGHNYRLGFTNNWISGEILQVVSNQHSDVCLVPHFVTVELCEPVPQAGGQVSLPNVFGRVMQPGVLVPGDALVVPCLVEGDGALTLQELLGHCHVKSPSAPPCLLCHELDTGRLPYQVTAMATTPAGRRCGGSEISR